MRQDALSGCARHCISVCSVPSPSTYIVIIVTAVHIVDLHRVIVIAAEMERVIKLITSCVEWLQHGMLILTVFFFNGLHVFATVEATTGPSGCLLKLWVYYNLIIIVIILARKWNHSMTSSCGWLILWAIKIVLMYVIVIRWLITRCIVISQQIINLFFNLEIINWLILSGLIWGMCRSFIPYASTSLI